MMPVERASGTTSLIDVLDRVLDKGVVLDAWVRVSLESIDLITNEARIVVASIYTHLKYSGAVSQAMPVSLPAAKLPGVSGTFRGASLRRKLTRARSPGRSASVYQH